MKHTHSRKLPGTNGDDYLCPESVRVTCAMCPSSCCCQRTLGLFLHASSIDNATCEETLDGVVPSDFGPSDMFFGVLRGLHLALSTQVDQSAAERCGCLCNANGISFSQGSGGMIPRRMRSGFTCERTNAGLKHGAPGHGRGELGIHDWGDETFRL